ncbi:signal peptidase I [Caenibacillus caldisaponilyticus]|uniref:signal peptidase I n=1 Tax=Caenibacillus caldisaponilyticus TaxID=1674942 RepID=UPI0009883908|nr:signal peptidase I [Caenibacillus caldisaponilyticus]
MTAVKKKSWGLLKPIAVAIILAAFVRYYLFAHIMVEGHSMMPTLKDRDHIIICKICYKLAQPKRFDIVVFHATEQADYIKRVIGLPGDTIEYKNDVLYVNGKPVDEPYLEAFKAKTEGLLTYNFKAKVPKGTVFVLGDNRRNSRDSRYIGAIPEDELIGKAVLLFWPLRDFKLID